MEVHDGQTHESTATVKPPTLCWSSADSPGELSENRGPSTEDQAVGSLGGSSYGSVHAAPKSGSFPTNTGTASLLIIHNEQKLRSYQDSWS